MVKTLLLSSWPTLKALSVATTRKSAWVLGRLATNQVWLPELDRLMASGLKVAPLSRET